MLSCSYQRIFSGDTGHLKSANARSKIGHVEMYFDTLVWMWDIFSPIVYNPASSRASPLGGTNSVCSGTRVSGHKSDVIPDDVGYSMTEGGGELKPKSQHRRAAPTEPPHHKTSPGSWCKPYYNQTGGRTVPIYSALYVDYEPQRGNCCFQIIAS